MVLIVHLNKNLQHENHFFSDLYHFCSGTGPKIFTEADRQTLVDGLTQSAYEIRQATEHLTLDQWHFKPSADEWSIAQAVEHMAIYERLVMQEVSASLWQSPTPALHSEQPDDAYYVEWMEEKKPHKSFNFADPLGLLKGEDNYTFFSFVRDQVIELVETTDKDLKAHFIQRTREATNRRSAYALLLVHAGHTGRHIRQIERIKSSPDYPQFDAASLMALMKDETSSFYYHDYEKWSSCWSKGDDTFVAWNKADGSYHLAQGWDQIDAGMKPYFKRYEEKLVHPDFYITNYKFQIGADFAQVTYDEYVANDENLYKKVPGVKTFVKVDGKWKFNSVVSFWHGEYTLTKSDVAEICREAD